MINGEKYKNEILKSVELNFNPAFVKGKIVECSESNCTFCIFRETDLTCYASFIKWMYKEYKEPIVLTKKQKYFLLALEDHVERIKREDDFDGNFRYTYQTKNGTIKYFYPDLISFDKLKWNEWYEIEEMLRWPVEGENEV